jgi:hypothetical protein
VNPEYAVELRGREPIFHHPELGTDRASFEAQTAPDYWEVGASGNVYRRDYIWEVLADRYAADEDDPWEIEDFACRPVGDGTYLVTYLLLQGERMSRRSTLWRRTGSGWRALYHQGTLISP